MEIYYVYIKPRDGGNGKFRSVEGEPIIIPGFEELDLFLHRPYNSGNLDVWLISEGKTGASITEWAGSQEEARHFALEKLESVGLDKVRAALEKRLSVEEYRSPKYNVGNKIAR